MRASLSTRAAFFVFVLIASPAAADPPAVSAESPVPALRALETAQIIARKFTPHRPEHGDTLPLAVTLPDAWLNRPERNITEVTYRLSFLAQKSGDLWAYLPRVRTNARMQLNGAEIWNGGSMQPPLTRHANAPFFFALPEALLREGENQLEITVASPPKSNGGLSKVWLGSRAEVWPKYAQRQILQQGGVMVTSAVIAATSLYIFFIWLELRRRQTGYLYLALAGLVWAARNLNLIWMGGPIWSAETQWLIESLTFLGHGLFFGLLGLFFLHEYEPPGSRLRRIMTWAIVGFIVPGILLIAVYRSPTPALSLWMVASAPLLLGMAWILLRHAMRAKRVTNWLYLFVFVLLLALNVHDNLVLMGKLGFERIYLAHYGGLAFFLAIAHMLVLKYSEANLAFEQLNLTLEDRLRKREDQLRQNFAAIGQMEKTTAVLEERGRIMRDLHDGLGAQLLSAIHKLRRDRDGALNVEQVLQDCLADMRLVIEVSEPEEASLGSVIGGVRYQLEQRLASAGLHLSWEIGDLPDELDLGPTRTLQLVRIMQEAISNVLKHAGATVVRVVLEVGPATLRLAIIDNGRGFDTTQNANGHGLNNMQRRAKDLGGVVRIESGAKGTVVELRLALTPAKKVQASSEPLLQLAD